MPIFDVIDFDAFAEKYCERMLNDKETLYGIFLKHVEKYQPQGWAMLECQNMSSSRMGDLSIVPFGPNNTWKQPPDKPVSPRGLSSDMSVTVAVLFARELPQTSEG